MSSLSTDVFMRLVIIKQAVSGRLLLCSWDQEVLEEHHGDHLGCIHVDAVPALAESISQSDERTSTDIGAVEGHRPRWRAAASVRSSVRWLAARLVQRCSIRGDEATAWLVTPHLGWAVQHKAVGEHAQKVAARGDLRLPSWMRAWYALETRAQADEAGPLACRRCCACSPLSCGARKAITSDSTTSASRARSNRRHQIHLPARCASWCAAPCC